MTDAKNGARAAVLPVLPTQLPTDKPTRKIRLTSWRGKERSARGPGLLLVGVILLSIGTLIHYTVTISVLDRHADAQRERIETLQEEVQTKQERIATLVKKCEAIAVAAVDDVYNVKDQRIAMLEHLVVDKEQRIEHLIHNYGIAFDNLKAIERRKVEHKNQRIATLERMVYQRVDDNEEQQRVLSARLKACDNTLAGKNQRIATLEEMVEDQKLAIEIFEPNGHSTDANYVNAVVSER